MRKKTGKAEGRASRDLHFLGFTHSCAKTRKGKFTVLRQTMRTRWQAKLKGVKVELYRRMHEPVPEMGAYVRAVLVGHMHYYAVPMNAVSVSHFRMALGRIWWRVLKRRSQKSHLPWARMERQLHGGFRILESVILIHGCALALLPEARAGCRILHVRIRGGYGNQILHVQSPERIETLNLEH